MKPPINQQVDATLAALSKNTPTAAGPTISDSPLAKQALIDAIQQMFAEFELVYHNQFTKAFGSEEKLKYALRLWYSHLKDYPADTILAASKMATRQSEYLPTVHTLINCCDRVLESQGLPSARSAYREACLAPAPKYGYSWSHPLVYYAGRDTGWKYLHETAERYALPVFSEHYLKWRHRVQQGEVLQIETPKQRAETPRKRISGEEKHQRLSQLRDELGL